MPNTIVFVEHHDNQRDDLAWTHLGELGFDRQLVCPFKGDKLDNLAPNISGTVIYGGSQNVTEIEQFPFLESELQWIASCIKQNIPVLGLCLGGQLIAHSLGGFVSGRNPVECEFGYYQITPSEEHIDWIPSPFYVTQAHYQEFTLPPGARRLASSERFANQAFRYQDHVIGLQFHPEVTREIFERWQVADWAMYDIPGSQTRKQQDVLVGQHHLAQANWFKRFLEGHFGNPGGH